MLFLQKYIPNKHSLSMSTNLNFLIYMLKSKKIDDENRNFTLFLSSILANVFQGSQHKALKKHLL